MGTTKISGRNKWCRGTPIGAIFFVLASGTLGCDSAHTKISVRNDSSASLVVESPGGPELSSQPIKPHSVVQVSDGSFIGGTFDLVFVDEKSGAILAARRYDRKNLDRRASNDEIVFEYPPASGLQEIRKPTRRQ
jgi:hypothetical protein